MLSTIIFIFSLLLIVWILFSHHKSVGKSARAVNMSLFLIDSPDEFMREKEFSEIFNKFHHQGWNRLLYGEPYVSLEKRTENREKEYYLGIPKYYEWLLEDNPRLAKTGELEIPEGGNWEIIQILVRHSHRKKGMFEARFKRLNRKNVEKAFDFFLRLFENKKRVELSFEELKKNFLGVH